MKQAYERARMGKREFSAFVCQIGMRLNLHNSWMISPTMLATGVKWLSNHRLRWCHNAGIDFGISAFFSSKRRYVNKIVGRKEKTPFRPYTKNSTISIKSNESNYPPLNGILVMGPHFSHYEHNRLIPDNAAQLSYPIAFRMTNIRVEGSE